MDHEYGENWTEDDKKKEMEKRAMWPDEIFNDALGEYPSQTYVETRGRKRKLVPPESPEAKQRELYFESTDSDIDSDSDELDEMIYIPGLVQARRMNHYHLPLQRRRNGTYQVETPFNYHNLLGHTM